MLNLDEQVKLIDEIKESVLSTLKDYVLDKSYSLDDRWTAFMRYGHLIEPESYVQHFKFLGDFNAVRNIVEYYLYGDNERQDIIFVRDLLEVLEEPYDSITKTGCLNRSWKIKVSLPWPKDENGKSIIFRTGDPILADYFKKESELSKIVIFTEEHIKAFKEECLSTFLYSFYYDW